MLHTLLSYIELGLQLQWPHEILESSVVVA